LFKPTHPRLARSATRAAGLALALAAGTALAGPNPDNDAIAKARASALPAAIDGMPRVELDRETGRKRLAAPLIAPEVAARHRADAARDQDRLVPVTGVGGIAGLRSTRSQHLLHAQPQADGSLRYTCEDTSHAHGTAQPQGGQRD
jgi:hypothetical protein